MMVAIFATKPFQLQSMTGSQSTARRQIQALESKAPGAHLEWIFTHNEELAKLMDKAVTRYLERNPGSVTVDVKFAPKEG